jgi:hypothetical protein
MRATWKPHEKSGTLTKRSDLPSSVFAYPKERKEPMTNASHVRNAIARFDQVEGVSDAEREQAFANIKKAAKYYGVDMTESSASDLPAKPRSSAKKKASARKAAATRKKKTSRKKTTARKKTSARKKTAPRKKTVPRKKTASRKKAVRKKR